MKIFLSLLLSVWVMQGFAQKVHPFDNYFLQLPDKYCHNISKHERQTILNNLGKPVHRYIANAKYVTDTVDRKNAFLQFHTKGDKGGMRYQMTVWIKPDKTRLIGWCQTDWVTCCSSSEVSFYTHSKTGWLKHTDVLPVVTNRDFLEINEKAKKMLPADFLDRPAKISLSLPQHGRDIEVSFEWGHYEAGHVEGIPDIQPLLSHIKIKHEKLLLKWKGDGTFEKVFPEPEAEE